MILLPESNPSFRFRQIKSCISTEKFEAIYSIQDSVCFEKACWGYFIFSRTKLLGGYCWDLSMRTVTRKFPRLFNKKAQR